MQYLNIREISSTLTVENLETSIEVNSLQLKNIPFISVTFSVLKLDTSKLPNFEQSPNI